MCSLELLGSTQFNLVYLERPGQRASSGFTIVDGLPWSTYIGLTLVCPIEGPRERVERVFESDAPCHVCPGPQLRSF